jgi:hypothetical protein
MGNNFLKRYVELLISRLEEVLGEQMWKFKD